MVDNKTNGGIGPNASPSLLWDQLDERLHLFSHFDRPTPTPSTSTPNIGILALGIDNSVLSRSALQDDGFNLGNYHGCHFISA